MFGYRHVFHAGNHADVFKHVVLTALLEALRRKEGGFCFHDTHAGIGLYNLRSDEAAKNKEYRQGVERVMSVPNPPAWVQEYLDVVRAVNPEGKLEYYPGSPMIARKLMRPQDQMVLTELNTADNAQLKEGFFGDRQVAVHLQDAWQGMKAFLPPRLKRGLVLIDPPYELKHEPKDLGRGLQVGHGKWPTGMYAIWYPIFKDKFAELLRNRIASTGIRKILDAQLVVRGESDAHRMIGSGMMIVNPPWQFEEHLAPVMVWLQKQLALDTEGVSRVQWLVPE